MSFGGQLLPKKKTYRTSTKKIEVSRESLLQAYLGVISALGYGHSDEIIEIDAPIPKIIPITIRKKVLSANKEAQKS